MSRKISLNLELNKRCSRLSNHTPGSERSSDTVNSSFSSKPSISSHSSRLKETIMKTRETLRSRMQARKADSGRDHDSSFLTKQ